jgi:hypothetical protein
MVLTPFEMTRACRYRQKWSCGDATQPAHILQITSYSQAGSANKSRVIVALNTSVSVLSYEGSQNAEVGLVRQCEMKGKGNKWHRKSGPVLKHRLVVDSLQ